MNERDVIGGAVELRRNHLMLMNRKETSAGVLPGVASARVE